MRGSPLTAKKLAEHAARTARAYTYEGAPCRGISVELSRDATDTAPLLKSRRLSTRRRLALIRVEDALHAGFVLLPTFGAPHYTIVIDRAAGATVAALVALAARNVIDNPHCLSRKEG